MTYSLFLLGGNFAKQRAEFVGLADWVEVGIGQLAERLGQVFGDGLPQESNRFVPILSGQVASFGRRLFFFGRRYASGKEAGGAEQRIRVIGR